MIYKKKIIFYIIFLSITLLSSCNIITNIDNALIVKKNINQYTDKLLSDRDFKNNFKAQMISDDMYVLRDFPDSDKNYIRNFFINLKKNDYINLPVINSNDKFKYKIIITTSNNKYVINLYNNKVATLHTWDGKMKFDTFTVSNSKPLYNIFELCLYLNNHY